MPNHDEEDDANRAAPHSKYEDLAGQLKAQGHQVTILEIARQPAQQNDRASKCKQLAEEGIRFVSLPQFRAESLVATPEMSHSWLSYQWLKKQGFDVIHFPVSGGLAYYSLLAKRQGLAFENSLLCVHLERFSSQRREENGNFLDKVDEALVDFLEQKSVELADACFSEGEEALTWGELNGWRFPDSTFRNIGRQRWLSWHRTGKTAQGQSKNHSRPAALPGTQPLVSLCLIHHNRPRLLKQALASIQAQDYPNLEVVLVDDGSTDSEALAYLDKLEPEFALKNWQLVRQENLYLGAARNNAARHARGEYLLFMDDDNYAKPAEVSTLVSVAQRTGADVLTCQLDQFEGDDPPVSNQQPSGSYLFLGDAPLALAINRNFYGDANSFFRASSFWSIGGFTDDFGIGHEDWEVLGRASRNSLKLETVPEALVWYRTGSPSRSATATATAATASLKSYMRSLRPFTENLSPELVELLKLTLGLHLSQEKLIPQLYRTTDQLEEKRKKTEQQLSLLRDNIYAHWWSKSLRLTAPARRVYRFFRGLGPEPNPQARTLDEALSELDAIHNSLSWNLTAPFRAVLIAHKKLMDCLIGNTQQQKSGGNLASVTRRFLASAFPRGESLALSLVKSKTGGNISEGPFKGMRYVEESIGSAFYPKLLGTYELELQDLINRLCDEQFDVLLNIGAGEGYYAVGFALRCPQMKIIAAEEDELRRHQLIIDLARKNNVLHRIELIGRCDPYLLLDLLKVHAGKRTLILMDVEGYEAKLLDPSIIPMLKECTILAEIHDGMNSGPIGDELAARFYATHEITRTWYQGRTSADLPFRRPFLDKYLLEFIDEHRKYGLCWQYIRPRAFTTQP
jgi:glycosyltransferase involved in cell wall biosynthesis